MHGITLVEILVAVTIVAMVTVLTVPSFGRAVDSARFNAAARDLVSALKTARYEARRERREVPMALDTEALTYVLDDRERQLRAPSGTTLGLLTADSELVSSVTGAIRFFPDGSSTGGTITIAQGNRSLAIDVDWLTGRVTEH